MPKRYPTDQTYRRKGQLPRVLLLVVVVLVAGAAFAVEHLGGQYGIPTWGQLHDLLGVPLSVPQVAEDVDTAVTILDVGQGSAALIAQDGAYCLIDAGPADAKQQLVNDLRQLGVRELRLMVLSHPHSDHIGGAVEVLENFTVDEILVTSAEVLPTGSSWQSSILGIAKSDGIPVTVAQAGQNFAIGGGTLQVLQANYQDPQAEDLDDALNDTSICTLFTAGGFSYLTTGDAEAVAEQQLVDRYGTALRATLLTAGHHGSYTSSGAALLSAVKPQAVAISCGVDNDYGHPHDSTLRRIAAQGAQVYRTDTMGSITFTWRKGVLQAATATAPQAEPKEDALQPAA